MPHRRLGSSDIEVSVVGLGGNTFGPPRLDESQTKRVIDAAFDLGVNFVDTANIYGQGFSEEFLGKALVGRRDEIVLATKFRLQDIGDRRVSDYIISQAEESLRKLQTDRIDLLQVHFPNPAIPAEELLQATNALVETGKVRLIGACNYASWRLAESAFVASTGSMASFQTVQNYYHLFARQTEAEVSPFCEQYGVSILPYHPLAGGFLTGKYRLGEDPPPGTRGAKPGGIVDLMRTDDNWGRLALLEKFAAERDRRVNELAIAWLIANPLVASVIAGVSSPEQLAANTAAAGWLLTSEELAQIDSITVGEGGVPTPERYPYIPRPTAAG
jgi:aryl-alcohol dehydrogenase-like predicted oxidoreductase